MFGHCVKKNCAVKIVAIILPLVFTSLQKTQKCVVKLSDIICTYCRPTCPCVFVTNNIMDRDHAIFSAL